MALSTTIVVSTLKALGLYTENQLHGQGEHLNNFVLALSIMALTQFIANTTFASIYGALKTKPLCNGSAEVANGLKVRQHYSRINGLLSLFDGFR